MLLTSTYPQECPIELDEEGHEPAATLLHMRTEVPSPTAAFTSLSPIITSLPFLQPGAFSSTPATSQTPRSSPDLSAIRNRLTALSNHPLLPTGGLTPTASSIDLTTALTSLKTLLACSPEDIFGEQATTLRDSLTCMSVSDTFPHNLKDTVQSFLFRIEGNCSALRMHKPVIDHYRNLRVKVDSYNADILKLLDHIDGLEGEYNKLVAAAAEL